MLKEEDKVLIHVHVQSVQVLQYDKGNKKLNNIIKNHFQRNKLK